MAVAGRLLIETSGVDGYLLEDGSGVLTIDPGLCYVNMVETIRTGVTDPQTWSHTVPAEARAFLVFIGQITSVTDHEVSVTVGGVALRRVVRATDTAVELGIGEWWILESGIPTGVQTVSVDLDSATTDDMYFLSLAFIGERDIEVIASGSLSEDQADPAVALGYLGRTCIGLVGIFSGHGLATDLKERAGQWQTDADWTFSGSTRGFKVSQRPLESSDQTLGYFSVSGFSDDCAMVALAIAETLAPATIENRALHRLHAAETYPSGLMRF